VGRLVLGEVGVRAGDAADRYLARGLHRHREQIAHGDPAAERPQLRDGVRAGTIGLLGVDLVVDPLDLLTGAGRREIRDLAPPTAGAAVLQRPLIALAVAAGPDHPCCAGHLCTVAGWGGRSSEGAIRARRCFPNSDQVPGHRDCGRRTYGYRSRSSSSTHSRWCASICSFPQEPAVRVRCAILQSFGLCASTASLDPAFVVGEELLNLEFWRTVTSARLPRLFIHGSVTTTVSVSSSRPCGAKCSTEFLKRKMKSRELTGAKESSSSGFSLKFSSSMR